MKCVIATLALLLAGIALLGCEEDLAIREHNKEPFSLYGILAPNRNTQSILVFPVEDFPEPHPPGPLDARVTSTDLNTGEIRVWKDSLVSNAMGQYEHVFWSDFRPVYGHTYRLEVMRLSDGAVSQVEVRIPPEVTVHFDTALSPVLHATVQGERIQMLTPVLEYVVSRYDPNQVSRWPILSYEFPYLERLTRAAQGWELTFRMDEDRPWTEAWYALDLDFEWGKSCPRLALIDLRFHFTVGDTVWNPPGGVFDPDILSQPGIMDNVRNGFGFVGGGYHVDAQIPLSPDAVEDACFYFAPELTRF